MTQLPSDERLPRYQRLRDQLAQQIADNRWRAGEAIPTEAVLAQEYELSVGTVRKAIDMLVGERILERQQGRGTFIRRPQFHASLFRFFRFQTPDGDRQIPQSRILAIDTLQAPADVARVLGIAGASSVIRLQRLRLLDDQAVLAEDIWLPRERFKALLSVDLTTQGQLLYPLYEELCGQIVASADETLSAEAADAHHADLLDIALGSPVVVIERLARNHAGQALEWRRSRGRASHFRYSVEIR